MLCKLSRFRHQLNCDSSALHSFKAAGQLFDVVDLDPYGSAVPFLDSAIANIADGGMSLSFY
jgi:tRNA G26 N,N-dimethylase Trm1